MNRNKSTTLSSLLWPEEKSSFSPSNRCWFNMESNGERPSLDVCFGDREITLFDEYERFSVEVQLNRTILRRSFSSPSPARFAAPQVSAVGQNQRFIDIDRTKKSQRLHSALKWWLKFRVVLHGWRSQKKGRKHVSKRHGGFNRSMRW